MPSLPIKRNPNPVRLKDPIQQRAQGLAMFQDRIAGMSLEEIATKYNTTYRVVEKRFRLLRREELLDKAVEQVVDRLLTKSLGAYESLLDQDTNLKVKMQAAHDIAFGVGVLSTNNRALVNPTANEATKTAMTLRAWREKRFASEAPTGSEGGVQETHRVELTAQLPEGTGAEDFADFGEDAMEGLELSPDDFEVEE